MQRLKRSQPAQTKHRGPGGLADAGPRIQKVHGAMHALPFIRGAKECPRGIAIAAPEAVKMQILQYHSWASLNPYSIIWTSLTQSFGKWAWVCEKSFHGGILNKNIGV